MKKKQITRKLSLNKQTLSLLDAQGMRAVRGGEALVDESSPNWPLKETDRTYTCC